MIRNLKQMRFYHPLNSGKALSRGGSLQAVYKENRSEDAGLGS